MRPKGRLNSEFLPSHFTLMLWLHVMASMIGKSQLDVCGAPIRTAPPGGGGVERSRYGYSAKKARAMRGRTIMAPNLGHGRAAARRFQQPHRPAA